MEKRLGGWKPEKTGTDDTAPGGVLSQKIRYETIILVSLKRQAGRPCRIQIEVKSQQGILRSGKPMGK
jgi:hypothetical protein